MSYSIIAPGVSPENFGAGANDSFVNRLTNNLYTNFKKADEFSTMMQNQNSRLRRRPSADEAAVMGSREATATDYNDMQEQMAERAVNTCNINGDNSAQCQAWKAKLDNIKKVKEIAAQQNQALLNTQSVLNTPSVLTNQPAMISTRPTISDSGNSTLFNWGDY